jgi:hypothetical protein
MRFAILVRERVYGHFQQLLPSSRDESRLSKLRKELRTDHLNSKDKGLVN